MTDKKWFRFNHLLSLVRTTAPLNPEGIRGDVCRFKMATRDVHFSPRAIAGPKLFYRGNPHLKETHEC